MNPAERAADRLLGYETTVKRLQLHLGALVPEGLRGLGDFVQLIECNDETRLRILVGRFSFSWPKSDRGPYTNVEVQCPTSPPPDSWKEYNDPIGTTWMYIPIELVAEYIWSHGGTK